MKPARALLAASILTAACAMPPEGTTEEDALAFDSALASLGCDLRTEPQYLAAELQTGLTRGQLLEMSEFKVDTGAAVRLEGGGVRLVTGSCAPTEPAPAATPDTATDAETA
ncbi:hypothetical protein ROJ8625_02095 [Roseivivax jejudonensis]|uniref:NADH dehydrogenase subunit E n=1 Tax=Roseivivax jejudonensis TaxID=1529041 RepID=A0A1X6Z9E2_9RHOB|nr:hypothetical protein [Roseivivax jejudonensis]SLN42709.1 hypothetical protein ROJ8625_02095 [Roseivivax jejudonensis]